MRAVLYCPQLLFYKFVLLTELIHVYDTWGETFKQVMCDLQHILKKTNKRTKLKIGTAVIIKIWPDDLWPWYVTFDLQGSHVASMTQIWLQSDLNFLNEAKFHIFRLS